MIRKANRGKAKRFTPIYHFLKCVVCSGCFQVLCCMTAYADKPMGVDSAYSIARSVINLIGILFIIIGITRFILSHAEENASSQTKAAIMIASGIAMIALGGIVIKIFNRNYALGGSSFTVKW